MVARSVRSCGLGRALRSSERQASEFGVWLAKQTIGANATRKNVGRITNDKDQLCPNCRSYREDSAHLNRCMDAGRSMLFKESVHRLGVWMESLGCTDSDLAYWIKKFLLTRGRRPCRTLRNMPPCLELGAGDLSERTQLEELEEDVHFVFR